MRTLWYITRAFVAFAEYLGVFVISCCEGKPFAKTIRLFLLDQKLVMSGVNWGSIPGSVANVLLMLNRGKDNVFS